ncbi:class C sortase [Serinibacter arcticus]|uniref:Sortase A, LPXTG specific n=1 Tax=Serinibacter arcticus TaxID=1655435 RepID=A0A4Z1E689_9MICO|nr:class C sortase [Serinibacter arcticus]TGO05247.1 Sortase A, LPXTG specific [Serinibacter arcticus]
MTTAPPPPVRPRARTRRATLAAAWRASPVRMTWQQWLVVVIAVAGVGVLVYPTAASWFSARVQTGQVASYAETVEALPSREAEQLLAEAHAYNDWLPRGPLRDPFRPDGVVEQTAVGDYVADYYAKLAVPGVEPMARLTIPDIGVDLPVLHGTDPAALTQGVGHIFGSSLPVGGESTHAVLTAHSGYVNATLFDELHRLVVGSEITIHVLGEALVYRVDQILEVLPNESDSLQVVEGEDLVTLITCTPIGVNTHRLLVRGERVDDPEVVERAAAVTAAPPVSPGFPWWAVAILGTGLASYSLARLATPAGAQAGDAPRPARRRAQMP